MQRLVLCALTLAALWASACGAGEPGAVGVSTGAADEPAPTLPDPDSSRLFEGNGMVIQEGTGKPELCLGAVLTSLPPQCGGLPIANWDWKDVEGEEQRGETRWGNYSVVGTFDGETFTVRKVGPYEDDSSRFESETDTSPPCPEPEGGWVVPDPAHNMQGDVGGARAYATSQPDYVSSWVDHLEEELEEFSPVVYVAVFTGDAERHETEIRKVWNGPLCVVERDVPTEEELSRIRGEVEAGLPELGLEMLWSDSGGVEQTIRIGVVVDVDGRAQAALDTRYGAGLVRLFPALRPVL